MPATGTRPIAWRRPSANDAYSASGSGTTMITLAYECCGSNPSIPARWTAIASRSTTAAGFGRSCRYVRRNPSAS
jgi:hypothetical protein